MVTETGSTGAIVSRPSDVGLKREVGFIGAVWASESSIIGSGWLFGSLYAAQVAGPAAIIAWVIGGVAVVILALIHAELVIMSDIVLAAEHAVVADLAHFPGGTVPGDGAHVIWPMLLGPNRARYFLMMGEQIPAAEARTLGLVGEVLPRERLLARAWEVGTMLTQKPQRVLRNTRIALIQRMKRHFQEELGYGLLLEGHGI